MAWITTALYTSDAHDPPLEAAALIGYLLQRYHSRHREQLVELIALARTVEQRHATHPNCPVGVAEELCVMQQALESHMRKEEQVLFPMIVRGDTRTAAPIAVMRMEHSQHRVELARLAELAHEMTPPADACGSWRVLCAGLCTFRDDLAEHMRLEDDVLFVDTAHISG